MFIGARIVRIATHPEYQRMGYGLRTMKLLQKYYEVSRISNTTRDGNPSNFGTGFGFRIL